MSNTVTVYTTLTVTTTTAHGLVVGQYISISGNSLYNVTAAQVSAVVSATVFKISYSTNTNTTGNGGSATPQAPSLVRLKNTVTATTAAAHGFAAGTQIVVSGVGNTNIGGGISACSRDGNGNATFTTASPHGLPVGAVIATAGVTDTSFDGTFTVASVSSTTAFTVALAGAAASSSGGNVQDIWNGTFVIGSVPTATSFTYTQAGANDQTSSSGTASVQALMTGGAHKLVVMFQTRQGLITSPSPVASFTASGGQQLLVSNLPIGPSNVIARVLGFTATGGDSFFVIPALPAGGGTSTIVGDNTSTQAVVDFADNTLMAATGIDIPGNNLFAQVTLGPCRAVGYYSSRLAAWGDSNKLQNLVNMGFDGGYTGALASAIPLGWTSATAGGALANPQARSAYLAPGFEWQITGDGSANARGQITQSAYQDGEGITILSPLASYSFRALIAVVSGGDAGSVVADLYSPTNGVLATATLAISGANSAGAPGALLTANFSAKMPATIPSDTLLRIYATGMASGQVVALDEIEVRYQMQPEFPQMRFSYVNNPEAFDGVTGTLGPVADPTPIMTLTEVRDTAYLRTLRGHYATVDNGSGEPSSWRVPTVSTSTGALSLWSCDPGWTGAGDTGEEWDAVASRGGAYLFAGGYPMKVSQEIQPTWERINWAAQASIWLKNDNTARRLYIGVPLDSATAPSALLVLDYRELLPGAANIADSPPVHISFTGKMIASDLTRKWTQWNLALNYGEIVARAGNVTALAVANGNGVTPGNQAGYGNAYWFDPAKYTDDDYGTVAPSYTTYFFINHEMEQALGTGSHRKLATYLSANVNGQGLLTITPLVDSLSNPWPKLPAATLAASATHDLEWGLNVSGERIAFKVESAPASGQTDNSFNLTKLVVTLRAEPMAPVRGAI